MKKAARLLPRGLHKTYIFKLNCELILCLTSFAGFKTP